MNDRPQVSVILTTYNRSDALLAVLRGLCEQTDLDFDVIVADDGSSEPHVRALLQARASWPFALRHVWHPDVGFTAASARNLGAAACRGDYLILLDGDCVPQPDFITQHRRLARSGCFVNGSRVLLDAALSSTAIAGALPAPRRHPLRWLGWRIHGHCNKLAALWLRWPARCRRAKPGFRWKGIRSCNMGIWRSDFDAIDGFDQTFNGWGHEDADFVLRLHHLGLRRIDGWWATEVLHLWHREAARDGEQGNRERVLQRQTSEPRQVRATLGLSRAGGDQVRVTVLQT